MELRHLRYFKAVAENGGFARAARILRVAQSALSGQIHDLEEELGVPLFDRAKRQIRLTYHGELFLKDATTLLASADGAVANMQRSLRGEVGTLTIGFFAWRSRVVFSGNHQRIQAPLSGRASFTGGDADRDASQGLASRND